MVQVEVQRRRGVGGGGTWHADVRLAVKFVQAASPVDLAQVVAGAGVGVAWVDDLLHNVVVHGAGGWSRGVGWGRNRISGNAKKHPFGFKIKVSM